MDVLIRPAPSTSEDRKADREFFKHENGGFLVFKRFLARYGFARTKEDHAIFLRWYKTKESRIGIASLPNGTKTRVKTKKKSKDGKEIEFNAYNMVTHSNLKEHLFAHYRKRESQAHYEKSIIGVSSSKWNKCLYIDIDDHEKTKNPLSTTQICYRILKDFNFPETAFIETSVKNKGLHIAIRFDRRIDDDDVFAYIASFKDRFACKIEARTQRKAIRLPGSCTYQPCSIELLHEDQNLFVSKRYVSFIEWMQFEEERLPKNGVDKAILDSLLNTSVLKKPGDSNPVIKDLVFERQRKRRKTSIDISDVYLREYDRHDNMKILAKFAADNDLSISEFESLCRERDKGSRDLAKWTSDDFSKHCSRLLDFYKVRRKTFSKSRTPEKFFSNLNLLDQELTSIAHRLAFRLSESYSYKKNRERKKEELFLVTMEIFGKMIYDEQHPRKVKSRILSEKKKEYLLLGFQFPRKFFLQLKKKHKSLSRMNIIEVSNKILMSNIFVQLVHSKSGYCWNQTHAFCRQFEANCDERHRNESVADRLKAAWNYLEMIDVLGERIVDKRVIRDVRHYVSSSTTHRSSFEDSLIRKWHISYELSKRELDRHRGAIIKAIESFDDKSLTIDGKSLKESSLSSITDKEVADFLKEISKLYRIPVVLDENFPWVEPD